jgi:hypothetical protein
MPTACSLVFLNSCSSFYGFQLMRSLERITRRSATKGFTVTLTESNESTPPMSTPCSGGNKASFSACMPGTLPRSMHSPTSIPRYMGRDFPFPIDPSSVTTRDSATEGQAALDHFESASPLLDNQRQLLVVLNAERRQRHVDIRNEGIKQRTFGIGDLVILRKQVKSNTSKTRGPYRVSDRIAPSSYPLQKLPFLRGIVHPSRFCKENRARRKNSHQLSSCTAKSTELVHGYHNYTGDRQILPFTNGSESSVMVRTNKHPLIVHVHSKVWPVPPAFKTALPPTSQRLQKGTTRIQPIAPSSYI